MSSKPKAAPTPEKPSAKVPMVQILYGLSMIDPYTGEVYTSHPKPLIHRSRWTDEHMSIGTLVEV